MTRSGLQNESGGSQQPPCRRLVARPSLQTCLFPASSGNTGQDFVFTGAIEKDSNETERTRSSIK